ncbi:protein disulfide-isomerase A3 isoform X2 [Aplysia californica]|uniref:Protein disulfide-isomerase n=1 Tax=Aplysia californica TaxID=6500 RepID=A0ABM0JSX8_APLCA|nr:protein disulfide-isomerase A3 isoform X2 [Aplysia californica]
MSIFKKIKIFCRCGHCKRLAPEYERAATTLKKQDPPVALAKVDCTVETNVCSKHGVSGYPTLKVFKNGELAKDYSGPREADGIVKYMVREAGPVSKKLESADDARNFLNKASVGVIGFFESESSSLAKAFLKVADKLSDVRFAHTISKEVKEELKQTEDGIVLFRPKVLQSKFEDAEVRCEETSSEKIQSFIQGESLGLCGERTMSNAENFQKPLFVAYFNVDYVKNPKGTNYWRNRVMKVGKKIKDEGETVYFAISGLDEMSRELEECGIEDRNGDKPVVCAWNAKNQKFKMTEEFSMDSFEQFVRDVLAGKVEAYMKSEPIPEDNDTPGKVKVVVGKNFDEIVNNEDKDVLIEFYAPWCGHCKSLAPKYDELAEKLKDEENVVIAKMDATANDVPPNYEVRGFPTIYFAPKGNKSTPKKYEGGREVDDFVKYLSKEATDGLKSVSKDSKKKKKDKNVEL